MDGLEHSIAKRGSQRVWLCWLCGYHLEFFHSSLYPFPKLSYLRSMWPNISGGASKVQTQCAVHIPQAQSAPWAAEPGDYHTGRGWKCQFLVSLAPRILWAAWTKNHHWPQYLSGFDIVSWLAKVNTGWWLVLRARKTPPSGGNRHFLRHVIQIHAVRMHQQ